MTENPNSRAGLVDRLATRITRRGLATSSGFAVAGALLGDQSFPRASAQNDPDVSAIINTAITLEAFMVTFYGAARGLGKDLALDDHVTRFVRAAQCEEEAHFHFFEAAGAVPSTTTFTIDTTAFTDQSAFLAALLPLESACTGAYMAAVRRFAISGDARLAEIAYQIGAVEAQHQALTRFFSTNRPGSDRAFAKWMFHDPADVLTVLSDLGYIDGNAEEMSFPGPVDRYCRGLTGLVPETTEDQPAPTPAPKPAATPEPTGVAG